MFDLIQQGGPIMWFMLIAAFMAIVIFLERLFHLHRAQIRSSDFLKGIYTVLGRGNVAEAVSICEETPGPVAFITRIAVLHHDESPEVIQQSIEEAGLAEVPRLERNMNLLATIAKVTPLAGLLGTVIGMLRIFVVMQQHAPLVQIGELSTGMVEALITTAAGLVIAIPSYVGYNFLVGRIESIVLDMEHASIDIQGFLSGKSFQNADEQ
ncbi:MAG: MotA/TolQ/ExbB proton channel family protein [Spartobacteria bacterium]|nr:MotA/TolQ/ExbB proton channel family protein [Spartobacteria bacterium]